MARLLFLLSLWKVIKNTHRRRSNRALHVAGSPLYASGVAILIANLAGYGAAHSATSAPNPVLGILLLLAGIGMFTLGHKIEGNLGSITPVLASRLVLRNTRRYFAAHRIHVSAP